MRRQKTRNPAQRLRSAVDALPERTRTAMLRGIDGNRIIVGAYTDPRSGGICPMLAAHRNGGRTDLASFAVAWDAFTGARRPRLATRREVRTLRSFLEISLLTDEQGGERLTDVAARIRAESDEMAARIRSARAASPTESPGATAPASLDPPAPAAGDIRIRHRRDAGERHRGAELRDRLRWTWMRPSRRDDTFKDLVAAAQEQLAEQRAAELLGDSATSPEVPAGSTPAGQQR